MKKIISTLFSLLFTIVLFAQQAPPQGINYQAMVYVPYGNQQVGVNSAGQIPANTKEVLVKFTLEEGNDGQVIYEETHTDTTDQYGLLNTVIGTGTLTSNSPGLFNQIDWSLGDPYLRVSITLTQYNSTVSSYQKLWSVPYALYTDQANSADYATQAGNGISGVTDNGDGTLTFNYLDGSTYTTGPLTGLGSVGPQGQAGANGQSAYDLWLAQGNTGTQQDFLSSLQGATGPQGPSGLVGLTGPQGPIGLTGATGPQGPIGITGPSGATGPQGPIGLTGPTGAAGTNGKNTLVKTTTETVGANCTTGGVKLEYGLDANSNNVLDAGEINAALTKYVCNGAVGATGLQGIQGPAGTPGSQNAWSLTGNAGTNPTTNFIGTTDAQDWTIKTNNTERMRVSSAGNVGIGVNNPSHTLQAENNLGRFLLSSTTGATFVERNSGTPLKVIMGSNDNSQNLGMIELSRGNGSGESGFIFTTGDGSNGVGSIAIGYGTPGIRFKVNYDGKVAIGTNSPDALLSVNGTASKAGGGSWATFSDRRVKYEINQFNDGLDVLMKLNPVTFKYNEKSGYTDVNKTFVGFIAQDVETVAPYMVELFDDSKGPSGLSDKRQFDESALNKILVNAVQEQQAQIEQLKKELEEMKSIVKELKKN